MCVPACGTSTPRRRFSAHTQIRIAVKSSMFWPGMRRVKGPTAMDRLTLSAVRLMSTSGSIQINLLGDVSVRRCTNRPSVRYRTKQRGEVKPSGLRTMDARLCATCSCGKAQKLSESKDILQGCEPLCIPVFAGLHWQQAVSAMSNGRNGVTGGHVQNVVINPSVLCCVRSRTVKFARVDKKGV